MNEILNLSRRGFLRAGVAASGGLILGVHLSRFGAATAVAGEKGKTFIPNAFIRIGSDDAVTVIVNHSEMGQGPYTTIPMLVADELDADWSKVHFEPAPVDPVYNHSVYGAQMTGGSTSTWSEWDRVRKAGAAARMMLVTAAAQTWNVEPSTCRTEKSFVIHDPSNRRLSYGELTEKAAQLKPPQKVTVKDPKAFRIIGKDTKRLDTPAKTDGSAIFGLDVNLPGMLIAVVERSPVFGGKVKSFNADKAKAIPGVRHVVQIDRGIAVVADGFWPATLGREALEIVWDEGPLASLDTTEQGKQYAELAQKAGAVARNDGNAAEALSKADKKFEAIYDLPYLAHAAMEPLNCVADVRADHCEVWVGTQFQTGDFFATVQETGLRPDQVKLHTTFLGGGFGRRAVIDSHFVREAVQISKKVKAPIKVIWTREDDMRGGYYRPRAYHTVSAALDAKGHPVAWKQRIVCQSFVADTPFEGAIIRNGVDATAVEGSSDMPYKIPNLHVDWQKAPGGVPTLWLRSVGHTHSAFVVETFLDELAHAAGKDPVEFRRSLLDKKSRQLRVLNAVAEKAGWGGPLAEDRGRGVAVHESFGSFIAHVVEASVSPEGKVTVHRVVSAVDCGPVVNPDSVRAQIEGGVVFGLTAALYGEITFEKGRVKQGNFNNYPMLRMNEMPVVEVHIVESKDRMGGVGEPGVPPVAPALANAIFAVTGKRVRTLPIRRDDLRKA
jgi:isoquinoline 1-oxidoreductase beta subunit